MNNKHIIYRILFACFFLFAFVTYITGQEKKDAKSQVQIEIVSDKGIPIVDAKIASSKNRYTYTVDESGKITIPLHPDDQVKIMAKGYETQVVGVTQLKSDKVVMNKMPDYAGEENILYTPFGQMTERRTVGSYSKIDGEVLETNPSMNIMNALGGRLNGLFSRDDFTMDNAGWYRNPNSSDYVRASTGRLIILVDGVERSLEYVDPETVESVQLIKDASLKALYGGIESNGILMIKTKRGRKYENHVRVNVQTGIQTPSRLPKYLDSYEYATLYNQALVNSGQEPYFKNPESYKNGDPLVYPNIDYYDMFLNDNMTITKANAQFSGGNEKTSYFTHIGFRTNGGLEKFTDYPSKDQMFSLRGNVDNTIKNFITLRAGFNAVLHNKQWYNSTSESFFNVLSDNRPNEFPIFIPGDRVGNSNEFVLGGAAHNQNNPYGILTKKGYADRDYSYIQTDFNLDVNLDQWVKGLSVKPGVTFDIYNYMTSTQGGTFTVYEPILNADQSDITDFRTFGRDTRETKKSKGVDRIERNVAFNVTAAYNRTFGNHDINALFVYFQQSKDFNYLEQKLKRMNIGATVNYMYNDKYIADVSVNHVGVGSFRSSKRFGTFPTFGAGWIMSEESFLKDTEWLDFLKVKASYGILGSTSYTADGLFSAYLYRNVWKPNGTYDGVGTFNDIVELNQTGNPDAGFQKSYELNIGADFQLLNKSITGSVGYFHNKLKGGLINGADMTPGVIGKGNTLPMINYKGYVSKGWEAEVMYQKKFGDWKIGTGVSFTYGKTDITKQAEPNYPEGYEGLRKITKIGDQQGLRVIGTFADQNEIDNSPKQLFGTVLPGDFKYEDTNGDGVVDDRDRVIIANTMPSIEYGITIKLEYKGFNLDVLGYGLAGFDQVLNTKYYQIYGNRKYSEIVNKGLPNGNPHPVLRAEYSNNNFKDSDYWIVDGSYFKIRNLEFGYTLPHLTTSRFGINTLKFFMRGTNLLTFSKIKDSDPENINAGITNSPLFTTITGGLSFSF